MLTLPFSSFLSQLIAALDSRPVAKLVVDLRQNTGGNSAILFPFINAVRARPTLNRRGNLFVAIDNGTFSSGMLNAVNFLTQTPATFVGEPTGGKPNSYGEVRSFNLPYSNLPVFYTVRFFQTVPGDPPSVMPDLPVEMSIDDLLAGRDPVLDAIIAL
jgi:C-terminal processing protease CtpA/Prc